MSRFAKSSVYSSSSVPIPVDQYKPTVPSGVTSVLNAIKAVIANAKRKALLLVSAVMEKLNISKIRGILSKIVEVRNTVMNAVSKGVAWVKAAAEGMAKLVSDVVSGVKNLTQTLTNLVKQSSIYQLANSVCSGFDLSGIADQISQIRVRINFDEAMDYALSGYDKDLFNHMKNCTLFNKDSVQKVKDAVKTMLDKSNFIMLDCMKDTTDYWDIHGIDRKLSAAAKVMDDTNDNLIALGEIATWMKLSNDFLISLNDSRFTSVKVYDLEETVSLNNKVPNYVKSVIGDTNRNLLIAASAYV